MAARGAARSGRVARPAVAEVVEMVTVMPSIADSVVEMAQWVFPEHAGAPGQIHGGRMMQWITEAGTLAAGGGARGPGRPRGAGGHHLPHPPTGRQNRHLQAPGQYVRASA